MTGRRAYDRAERTADVWVHGAGLLSGGIGACVLMAGLIGVAPITAVLATAVYCLTLLAMLICSAAFNLAPPSPFTPVLRRLDHAAIFGLIAGSATPFTFTDPDGMTGPLLGLAVWACALAGGLARLVVAQGRHEAWFVAAYLGLGWLTVGAFVPLLDKIAPAVLGLLAMGGILYSGGVVFHLWSTLRFQNALWHAFVVAAAACHFAAVTLHVRPPA